MSLMESLAPASNHADSNKRSARRSAHQHQHHADNDLYDVTPKEEQQEYGGEEEAATELTEVQTSTSKTNNNENNNNNTEDNENETLIQNDVDKYAENDAADETPLSPSSPVDREDPSLEHHLRIKNVLFRRCIFTTIPLFMGYAGLVTLQATIKKQMKITKEDVSRSDLFGVAVSFLYLGNLIFRLLHNIVFSFLIPRQRVMLSYTMMAAAHFIVGLCYFVIKSESLVWAFVCYALGGCAVGSLEANLLSVLTPLGHESKSWSVIGISVGWTVSSVGFFLLFTAVPHELWTHQFSFFTISAANVAGLLFFIYFIPYVEFAASHDTVTKFVSDLKRWREFFPLIKHYSFALMIDMAHVSMFTGVVYYIYDLDDIPIYPYAEKTIPKNVFRVWYNIMAFLGDFISRKVAYMDKSKRNPYYFLILSVLGAGMCLSKVALLAPFGQFLVMWANGSIYSYSVKRIDNVVDDRFNLISLSVFFLIGDIGSFAFANLVQPVAEAMGSVPTCCGGTGNITNSSNFTSGNLTVAAEAMTSYYFVPSV